MEQLDYSSDDFIKEVSSAYFPEYILLKNKFDKLLCQTWNRAQADGHFRYKLDDLQTKVLSGKYRFVAQLNVRRAIERRKPQDIISVSQAFNPLEFNFTKVAQHEILFEIKKVDAAFKKIGAEVENTKVCNGEIKDDLDKRLPKHLMIINVSPLEYCNSLMVPFINSCLSQILNEDSIKMAIELVLLSSTPAFRAGFNSLCASASVNHHHFHVYYLQYNLPIETLAVEHLVGDCYVTVGYPATGFVFQLKNGDVCSLTSCIFKVSNYMQEHNIAHNMMITRGLCFESVDKTSYDTIRVYLWARKSIYGIKDDTAFNVACCELSGHLPIKREGEFDTISEDEVIQILEDSCSSPFTEIKPKIIELLG